MEGTATGDRRLMKSDGGSDHPRVGTLSARASALAGCVRNWREVIGWALDDQAPSGDDERVEFLAGYIDPYASWEAILAESAHSFPGAAARARDVCDELVTLLEEVSARELLLGSAGFTLEAVQAWLDSVRDEVGAFADPAAGQRFAGLERSIERLALLLRASEVSARERQTVRTVLDVGQAKADD